MKLVHFLLNIKILKEAILTLLCFSGLAETENVVTAAEHLVRKKV